MKEDKIKNVVPGEVTEALPNTMFRVQVENGRILLCSLAGKMRIHYIKVMPGDRVQVELNDYDENRGRIVYRER
jgi:translation initiation factor IF-1